MVLKSRDQLLRALEPTIEPNSVEQGIPGDEALSRAVRRGVPRSIARRREPHSRRARCSAAAACDWPILARVTAGDLFVCVEIDDSGESEALVRLASAVRREWLPSDQLQEDVEVQFDAQREKVVAWKRVRIGDLVINETETKIPADVDAGEILAREAANRCDLQSLLDDEAEQFIARVKCLAQWMPELELPRWAMNCSRNSARLMRWSNVVCRIALSTARIHSASQIHPDNLRLSNMKHPPSSRSPAAVRSHCDTKPASRRY